MNDLLITLETEEEIDEDTNEVMETYSVRIAISDEDDVSISIPCNPKSSYSKLNKALKTLFESDLSSTTLMTSNLLH